MTTSPHLLGHLLEVARVIPETPDARTIEFAVPESAAGHFAFRPGQFLTLAIPSDRSERVARCYSISSSPSSGRLAVTVKRTPGGYASNWLCDNAAPGQQLRVLPPGGLFGPLSPEADLLLCTAGSGITPAMSILRTVLESMTGRVALFYANRDSSSTIFATELAALSARYGDRLVVEYWLESERGLPTAASLTEWARPFREREVYLCGPAPFMTMVRSAVAAAGFDTHRVRSEEYVSLTGDPFLPPGTIDAETLSDATTVEVTLDDVTHVLAWPVTHSLVDVMSAAGIDPPAACREGKCGACTCELVEGTVELGRTDALADDDITDGFILGCQATPTSPSVRVAF